MKRVLLVLLLVCTMCLVACGEEEEKKSPSDSKIAYSFADAFFTKDANKACKLIYKEILEARYENMNGCEEAVNKAIDHIDAETYGFKSFEERSKKEYTDKRAEDLAIEIEEDYGVSLENMKKAVRYNYKFVGRGTGNSEHLIIYLGKINGEWYVVNYDY